jgi:hypothetical protein
MDAAIRNDPGRRLDRLANKEDIQSMNRNLVSAPEAL